MTEPAESARRFQVDLRGIVEILSRHLYTSERVFIRELVQNAVDALSARTSQQLPPAAEGAEVVVTIDAAAGALRVTDTGIGLTEPEMEQMLATIGGSSKRGALDQLRSTFLGQFGIGLLSCFLVADEIVVRSRSARSATATTLRWTGRSDGTYTITPADDDLPFAGTEVTLVPRHEDRVWLDAAYLRKALSDYAELLPVRLVLRANGQESKMAGRPAPWTSDERTQVQYCRDRFGYAPLAVIDLNVPAAGVRGVGFVYSRAVRQVDRLGDRVYLRGMLLGETNDQLLPEGAFFLRAVLDAGALSPTASRESLQDGSLLREVRNELGSALRNWIADCAENQPTTFARFLDVHASGLYATAVADPEMLRVVWQLVPFETSLGPRTGAELAVTGQPIRYAATLTQFRAVADVAAAQQVSVVNAGYLYVQDLLELGGAQAGADVIEYDDAATLRDLADPPADAAPAVQALQRAGAGTAARRTVNIEVKVFAPGSVPSVYTPGDAGLDDAGKALDDLWAGVVTEETSTPATLVLNLGNRLVAEMARRQVADPEEVVTPRMIEALYVTARLGAGERLAADDAALLTQAFTELMNLADPSR